MPQHFESQSQIGGSKLNWLRAAVLGANDGITSVASIIAGVAGATDHVGFIMTAGIAGLTAGALSMAAGEYVSVSTQRDTELALIAKEKHELATMPEAELEELTRLYEAKGLSRDTAAHVAKELTAHDAFAAHAEVELRIDPEDLTNPWAAAVASALSFTVGGIVPLIAMYFSPAAWRVEITLTAVMLALAITGVLSAYAGGANKTKATLRVVVGGVFAMLITYLIGKAFGVVGI
ncbi:MAG TPA: VIT family protein [Candidatus Paceibacterota bacterium]